MKKLHEASSYLFRALGLIPFWMEREQHQHHSLPPPELQEKEFLLIKPHGLQLSL